MLSSNDNDQKEGSIVDPSLIRWEILLWSAARYVIQLISCLILCLQTAEHSF